MILGNKFDIETMLVHQCGQNLRVIVQVHGEDTQVRLNEDQRITCTAFFTSHHLYFYTQGGSHILKTCPTCDHVLPRQLAEVKDQDFVRLPEIGKR